MWWFAALHANLLDRLRQANIPPGAVLDAGCGTGGLLARLAASVGTGRAVGLDADLYACRFARTKSAAPVCAGSVDALPFADRSLAAILSADVLCHAGVDEERALAEFYRCLAPGGALILNLPAYRWMLSRHDIAVANVRRYTGRDIAARLHAAGFRACRTTYWNAVLFPVMVATRKLWRGGDEGSSDVRLYPAAVDALCRVATGLERMVFACGLRLPFGGSLIAVASKEK